MFTSTLISILSLTFLQYGDSTTRTLDSAWMRVLDAAKLEANTSKNLTSQRMWFLGFVEGTIGTKPPNFWEEAILGLRTECLPGVSIDPQRYRSPYIFQNSVGFPEGILVKRLPEKIIAFVDDIEFEIGGDEYLEELNASGCLSLVMRGNLVYFAIHSDRPSEYSLYCFDRNEKKSIWRKKIKPHVHEATYMGIGFHHVALVTHSQRVFLFGVAEDVVYLSSFDATTGAKEWHFSTEKQ